MQLNKYIFFAILLFVIKAQGMEEYNPKETIRITSFLYSLMAGYCTAYDSVIEFCDYQDTSLRHGFTFKNAKQLLEKYQKTSKFLENPLRDLFEQAKSLSLPKKMTSGFLKQDLTLQEAKEIQIYFFYKLMNRSKIRSVQDIYLKSFLNAIYATYFGIPDQFNTAMQIIEKIGSTTPHPTQRIEDYDNQAKHGQCFQ